MTTTRTIDAHRLFAFEDDELTLDEVIVLFADLISTGMVWQLQGFYGRTAKALIEAGYLDQSGNILRDPE